jgi:hypothetical protein
VRLDLYIVNHRHAPTVGAKIIQPILTFEKLGRLSKTVEKKNVSILFNDGDPMGAGLIFFVHVPYPTTTFFYRRGHNVRGITTRVVTL